MITEEYNEKVDIYSFALVSTHIHLSMSITIYLSIHNFHEKCVFCARLPSLVVCTSQLNFSASQRLHFETDGLQVVWFMCTGIRPLGDLVATALPESVRIESCSLPSRITESKFQGEKLASSLLEGQFVLLVQ